MIITARQVLSTWKLEASKLNRDEIIRRIKVGMVQEIAKKMIEELDINIKEEWYDYDMKSYTIQVDIYDMIPKELSI